MQELLGRLRALDPTASQSLRVIACFDELMAGRVGTEGLLSAAAALAGRIVGLRRTPNAVAVRFDPKGNRLPPGLPSADALKTGGLVIWIERGAEMPGANDAIILERLALALQLHYDDGRPPAPRDLATLFDDTAELTARRDAATRRGLAAGARLRVLAAPLFALWQTHPAGPEDVIATDFGPVHAAIVPADSEVAASPLGIGIAVERDDLGLSFRTALVALRLADSSPDGISRAEDLGARRDACGAADDAPDGCRRSRRVSAGIPPLGALYSRRHRAGDIGARCGADGRGSPQHHDGTDRHDHRGVRVLSVRWLGRMRAAMALLRWRVRTSRVFELPAPASGALPVS